MQLLPELQLDLFTNFFFFAQNGKVILKNHMGLQGASNSQNNFGKE